MGIYNKGQGERKILHSSSKLIFLNNIYMNSQINSQNKKPPHSPIQKKKTYSTLSRSKQSQENIDLVSPPQSSQAESNQIKYLSHLDKSNELGMCDYKTQFLSLFYKAVTYVRKDEYRTEIDDKLLFQELKQHIEFTMQPTPMTEVGSMLLMNGYVLVAFSILQARIHKSTFVLYYLFNMFIYNYEVIENEDELFEYNSLKPERFFIPEISAKKKRRSGEQRLKRSRMSSQKKEPVIEQENGREQQNN